MRASIALLISVAMLAAGSATAQPAPQSPLRLALDQDDFAAAEKLLEEGKDIDEVDAPLSKRTALFFADTRAGAWLIEHHADVQHRDVLNATALNFNVSLGAPARSLDDFKTYVDLLLAHGVDVNTKDLNGASALISAIANGKLAEAAYLLDVGADPRTVFSSTPALEQAVRREEIRGGPELIALVEKMIAKGADPNATTADRYPPLSFAGAGLAEVLLKHGATVDSRGTGGATPLMLAAGQGALDKVDLLLRYGAKPDLKDWLGCSALCYVERGEARFGPQSGSNRRYLERYESIATRLMAAGAGSFVDVGAHKAGVSFRDERQAIFLGKIASIVLAPLLLTACLALICLGVRRRREGLWLGSLGWASLVTSLVLVAAYACALVLTATRLARADWAAGNLLVILLMGGTKAAWLSTPLLLGSALLVIVAWRIRQRGRL